MRRVNRLVDLREVRVRGGRAFVEEAFEVGGECPRPRKEGMFEGEDDDKLRSFLPEVEDDDLPQRKCRWRRIILRSRRIGMNGFMLDNPPAISTGGNDVMLFSSVLPSKLTNLGLCKEKDGTDGSHF